MTEKDFNILRWKRSVRLKCLSLKDYLCLCFGCHLVMLKGKADFRNWSLYPLSELKWAALKRDFRLLLAALLWRLLSPQRGDRLRGLAGLQELMKAPQSKLSLFAAAACTLEGGWEKSSWAGRKGGACPATHCQLVCPHLGQAAFQPEITRQWVPTWRAQVAWRLP